MGIEKEGIYYIIYLYLEAELTIITYLLQQKRENNNTCIMYNTVFVNSANVADQCVSRLSAGKMRDVGHKTAISIFVHIVVILAN